LERGGREWTWKPEKIKKNKWGPSSFPHPYWLSGINVTKSQKHSVAENNKIPTWSSYMNVQQCLLRGSWKWETMRVGKEANVR
jgi:hypothetical protein